jgi:hypothetical protein
LRRGQVGGFPVRKRWFGLPPGQYRQNLGADRTSTA